MTSEKAKAAGSVLVISAFCISAGELFLIGSFGWALITFGGMMLIPVAYAAIAGWRE